MRFAFLALALCLALPAVTGCDKKKEDTSKDEGSAKKKKSSNDDDGEDKGKKKKSDGDDEETKKGECEEEKAAKEQVLAGREAITDKPPRAKEAFKAYSKAIALWDTGCMLSEKDQWDALAGAGISGLMTKKTEEAAKYLKRAAKKWPGIGETRYNLACAHCLLDDVDACYDELKATFEAAAAGKEPAFIKVPKDTAYWAAAARKDDDLASLRKDKRFEKLVSKYE